MPKASALKVGIVCARRGRSFLAGLEACGARIAARCDIDIHKAMDMTLPGLVSQQSILQEGAWLDVPNSRDWVR